MSARAKVDKIEKVQIRVLRKVVQDSSLHMKLNIAQGLKLELVFGVRPFHFIDNLPSRLALENLRETVAAVQKVLKRKLQTDNLPSTQ